MWFDDPQFFRLTVFLAGLGLLFAIESRLAVREWADGRGKRLAFHGALSILNTVILRLTVLTPFLLWADYVHTQGWGLAPWLGLQGAAEIIITVIVIDMFDYWWHRFNHRIGFLWRFHKVHHVDTHVDVTTALRFHPGELIISVFVWASWILIWGPSIWGLAAAQASITLAALFHHTNIDLPDPIEQVLRKLVVTPRFHTAHHTVSRRSGDANFSTVFIWWDHLFGTYREPDYREMRRLGLSSGRDSYLSMTETLREPLLPRNQDQAYRG